MIVLMEISGRADFVGTSERPPALLHSSESDRQVGRGCAYGSKSADCWSPPLQSLAGAKPGTPLLHLALDPSLPSSSPRLDGSVIPNKPFELPAPPHLSLNVLLQSCRAPAPRPISCRLNTTPPPAPQSHRHQPGTRKKGRRRPDSETWTSPTQHTFLEPSPTSSSAYLRLRRRTPTRSPRRNTTPPRRR